MIPEMTPEEYYKSGQAERDFELTMKFEEEFKKLPAYILKDIEKGIRYKKNQIKRKGKGFILL